MSFAVLCHSVLWGCTGGAPTEIRDLVWDEGDLNVLCKQLLCLLLPAPHFLYLILTLFLTFLRVLGPDPSKNALLATQPPVGGGRYSCRIELEMWGPNAINDTTTGGTAITSGHFANKRSRVIFLRVFLLTGDYIIQVCLCISSVLPVPSYSCKTLAVREHRARA